MPRAVLQVLLQRLRLAYWVAEHRITHGKVSAAACNDNGPVPSATALPCIPLGLAHICTGSDLQLASASGLPGLPLTASVQYVLKSIYQTEPIGGQSRAAGKSSRSHLLSWAALTWAVPTWPVPTCPVPTCPIPTCPIPTWPIQALAGRRRRS